MRAAKRYQRPPSIERLDSREVQTANASASLAGGGLTVVGSSTAAPMVIDVYAAATPKGPIGYVVVEGVGLYPAIQVKTVSITKPVAEPLTVRTAPTWNPAWRLSFTNPNPTPAATPAPSPKPAPALTPLPSLGNGETAAEQAIVNAVNIARTQSGLTPLSVDAKLVTMAHVHANDMARLQSMEHELPGVPQPTLLDRASHAGYLFSTLGENIAYEYPDTSSVMNGWMNSPGHRANIL